MDRFTYCLSIFVTIVACGGSDPIVGWRGQMVDSAGITIVRNDAPERGGEGGWRVDPQLTIGALDGDPHEVFGRVADAAVDSRGRILVLDQQSQEVRVFDARGAFVHRVGGPGRGPGELSRFVNAVLVGPADSIFVPDYSQARIAMYDARGAFDRHHPLPSLPPGHSWGRQDDGRFVYRGLSLSPGPDGRIRTWDALLRTRHDTEGVDTLLVFDYAASDLGGRGDFRRPLIVRSAFWARLPDGRIAWSSTDAEQLRIHRPDGTLERIVRHTGWVRAPVTETDRLAMVELFRAKMDMLGGQPSLAEDPSVDAPERFPAITAVRAGPDSTIWVQIMGSVGEIDPWGINAPNRSDRLGGATWQVFDRDGRWLADVRFPDRFRLMRLGEDYALGVTKDDLDVERVVRLRLAR